MDKEKDRNPKNRFMRICFWLFFLVFAAGFFLSTVSDILDRGTDPDTLFESEETDDKGYPCADLELLSAETRNLSGTEEWKNGTLQATVPELQDVTLASGYQLYQFDVKIHNKGNDQSDYDGSVYIVSDENDVITCFAPYVEGDKTDDTRILPPGREAVVTVYAQVKEGTKKVYAKTYNTRNSKARKMPIEME